MPSSEGGQKQGRECAPDLGEPIETPQIRESGGNMLNKRQSRWKCRQEVTHTGPGRRNRWDYLILPQKVQSKELLINSTQMWPIYPAPIQLLSFPPISQSLYTYRLEFKKQQQHNNLLGKVSWFSAFEHPCTRKWAVKASAAQEPCSPHGQLSFFEPPTKQARGLAVAGET